LDTPQSSRRALFVLLVASLLLVAYVFRPLAESILVGAVLAAVVWPVHSRLTKWLRGRSGLAAAIVLIGLVLLVIGPLGALVAFVIQQTVQAVQFVSDALQSEGAEGLLSRLPVGAQDTIRRALGAAPGEAIGPILGQKAGATGATAVGAMTSALATTGTVVFQTAMMLIALFFFLTKKEASIDWIDDASPLREDQTRELLAEVRKVSVSIVRSTVLTAGVQTIAALVGYLIVQVPYPLFFTGLTFFFALVPAIGAALATLLTAAILLAIGHPVGAGFLAGWGLLVVGLSDNVVKPWLMSGDVGIDGVVILFALLGGVAAFGAVGLLLGPLAVALFLAVLRIYRRDYGGDSPGGGGVAVADDTPREPSAPH
jgi:predicted PurR-regulated permease PerM